MQAHDTAPTGDGRDPDESPYGIVVMGASAGGLHALEEVLGGLPASLPAPIVVVQHLDPRHRSLMADILSRHTDLRVQAAVPGQRLEPGTVTIAVPDHHLLVDPDGTVALTQTELVRYVRPSIDLLFDSAAGSYRARALGVVLSGTGSDGASGVESIHQVGGTVIAQDPDTAEFGAMPRAAIATGCVDFVLPLDEIPSALVDLLTPSEAV